MIDHINLLVNALRSSTAFYPQALGPIGYAVLMEGEDYCGVGPTQEGKKWIGTIWLWQEAVFSPSHIAFRVERRDLVDAFYYAALAAGGKDNGAPGIRHHYHENYYAAFVIDQNGHNIEVVCHENVGGSV